MSPHLTSGTPAWHVQAQNKTNHNSGGNTAMTTADIKMSDGTVVETTGSNRTSQWPSRMQTTRVALGNSVEVHNTGQ